jgi:hypothetical protein
MVRAMKRALLGLALVTSCYRDRTDPETLRRLTAIEQRLDAQDKAITDMRTRADTTELSVLAENVATLRTDLDAAVAQMKTAKPAARPARREPDARRGRPSTSCARSTARICASSTNRTSSIRVLQSSPHRPRAPRTSKASGARWPS